MIDKKKSEIAINHIDKRLKGRIDELTAQRNTYIELMNVYKDLSKGRKDTKQVVDYINELETRLNEYEKAGGALDEGKAWYGLAKRYEQALDEIEKEIHSLGSLITIQDIINKTKDEE